MYSINKTYGRDDDVERSEKNILFYIAHVDNYTLVLALTYIMPRTARRAGTRCVIILHLHLIIIMYII